MVDIDNIKQKYCMDSKGAFGNEKNPMKKHDMRANLNNNAELENVKKELELVQNLARDANRVFSFGRSRKQGPAIKKAYDDAKKAIDRLWGVVEMRLDRLMAEK